MSITYRKSTFDDREKIDKLLKSCFGDRSKYGALDDIDGRYLLAFDGDELIAMTGLSTASAFNGYEIDWTCVSPTYRHNGFITNMIKDCIDGIQKPIYCSCLRLPNKEKINLNHAMNVLGFQLIIKNYKTYDSKHMKACNDCIYRKDKQCVCHEDLYIHP